MSCPSYPKWNRGTNTHSTVYDQRYYVIYFTHNRFDFYEEGVMLERNETTPLAYVLTHLPEYLMERLL